MVALHNRKLTARDIWPEALWDWDQTSAKQDEIAADLKREGITGSAAVFEASRRMSAFLQRFPRFSEQQAIMRKIYPEVRVTRSAPLLDPEEIDWLIDRLAGVNDPVGHAILKKLEASRPGTA